MQARQVGSKEEQGDNALAMASTNLLCNPHVQSNITLCNTPQSKMGNMPRRTEGGKTISQVRRAYFNQDNTSTSSSAINSINKRSYNNKLLINEATSTSLSSHTIDVFITTPPPNNHPSPTPAHVTVLTSTPVLVKKHEYVSTSVCGRREILWTRMRLRITNGYSSVSTGKMRNYSLLFWTLNQSLESPLK